MIPEGIGRYQSIVRRLLNPLFSRMWDFDVHGLGNIPTSGPAVLCPNHVAAIDSFFIPSVLTRNLIYVGKAEYLDDWKTSWLFPALGMIPIDRRGGDHAKAALDTARGILQRGELFGIYPEGTRSRSGKLHKGHTGAARLAIDTGSPIVPVGIAGSAEVQPVGSTLPKLFRTVTIKFGEPIDVERYRHRVGDRAVYRELIDEVMFEIKQLTGLEYEHTYAGKASETPSAVSAPAGSRSGPPDPPSSRQVLTSEPMASLEALLPAG